MGIIDWLLKREEEDPYEQLVKAIGECPDAEIGRWAMDVMRTLKELNGEDSAVHFADLLTSGDVISEGMTRANAYLAHVLEQGDGECEQTPINATGDRPAVRRPAKPAPQP